MLSGKRQACHFHGTKLYFAKGWEEKLREIGLIQGRRWDRLEPGECVSKSRRTNTYRVTLKNGERVFFKRYLYFDQPFKFFLKPSETAVEVFSYKEMTAIGIPTAEPVAVGEMRRCGALCSGCIVTREIPQTISLIEYALNEWPQLPVARRRQALTFISAAICRDFKKMHARNFFHIDPKWRNILIRKDENDKSEIQGIWWIDSPRGKIFAGRHHDYGMIYDLTNLNRDAISFLSRSQRLRFLKAYCGPKTSRQEIREIVQKINLRLQRRPAHIYRQSAIINP
jgi:hypothetical protein